MDEIKKIHLSETEVFITHNSKDAIRLDSGSLIVYVAPLKSDLSPDRRLLFCELKEGMMMPAFAHMDDEHRQWRFILASREGAELSIMEGRATSILRENFLKRAGRFEENKKFTETVMEFYHAETLANNVQIGRSGMEQDKARSEAYQVIKKSFGSDEERIGGSDGLYRAVAMLCHSMDIPMLSEEKLTVMYGKELSLQNIASAVGFAYREVVLEADWYKKDCGALIARIDNRPVACIPRGQGSYYIFYGDTGDKLKLTKEIAETVHPRAHAISRVLPAGKLTARDLLSYAAKSVRRADLAMVVVLGLVGALIGILLPTLNQKIYDDYIPLGNYSQLIQLCVVIGAFMLGNLFFEMVKNLSEFRIGSRVGYDLQEAVYYRVFRLPESFLRKQESADLAQKMACIPMFSEQIIGCVLVSGMGLVFGLLYLYKMFKYAKKLTWFAILMLLVYGLIVAFLATRTTKHTVRIQEGQGRASGKLFQLINGIEKLRMAGAEDRAAYQYILPFSAVQVEEGKKNRYTALVSTLSGAVATIFSMVFYFIIVKKNVELSTGSFMAFNAAFGSFSSSVLKLIKSAVALYQLKPVYERFRPVVETAEESDAALDNVEKLEGSVSLRNVKFSYEEDAPLVLNGIDLEIGRGEYIGIVGSSGCGKSTLLKLLLGFETPNAGQICYDGKDMRSLNKRQLRKNLGVVLQNGQLIAGSIMENITITAPKAGMREVNEVIRAVGLEKDIEQMPMGLQTMLSENSGTISGGQKQRILIARAIINKPAILIMDEATSALDNLTQAHVCSNLDRMNVTRIVIAHRLSTIKNCDRIIVLDKGRIAEEGNYEQLMARGGLFYQLAARQIVD